jgi:hypothetical protein
MITVVSASKAKKAARDKIMTRGKRSSNGRVTMRSIITEMALKTNAKSAANINILKNHEHAATDSRKTNGGGVAAGKAATAWRGDEAWRRRSDVIRRSRKHHKTMLYNRG